MSALKWYIVNTHVSCEARAKEALEKLIRSKGVQAQFGKILIPTENVVELVKVQRTTRSRKFFPGYMFVQMQMSEALWHLVKSASKVSGFVGQQGTPSPVPEEEVLKVAQQMKTGAEKPKVAFRFRVGDSIKVVDGPFNNFNGTVEEIDEAKSKVKVSVSIFGRPTPVELDFIQIARA